MLVGNWYPELIDLGCSPIWYFDTNTTPLLDSLSFVVLYLSYLCMSVNIQTFECSYSRTITTIIVYDSRESIFHPSALRKFDRHHLHIPYYKELSRTASRAGTQV